MSFNFGNWNWKHTWKLVLGATVGAGSAFLAAAEAYVQAEPSSTLLAAFGSINTAEPLLMGILSAGVVGVLQLAEHSFVAPPPGTRSSGGTVVPFTPSPVPAPRNDRRSLLVHLLPSGFALFVVACLSSSELSKLKTATDAAGNVCQIIVTAVDPSLPPLCTTADVIANAIEAFLASSSADGGATDGGVGAPSGATRDAVYAWVSSHGGTKLALP
jgi:hypothetical protein